MKPFGLRAEQRDFEQSYYGGYCNQVREIGLEPTPYVLFQEHLRDLLHLPKKERMKKLIELTNKAKRGD